MDMFGFRFAPGAWNLNNGWHLFSAATFDLDQILAYANELTDGCTIERLEWDEKDKRFFKVYITNIQRAHIGQNAKYRFHLIYSIKGGKLYKQTIEHSGETYIKSPVELKIDDY
jgi:hypothetical protein